MKRRTVDHSSDKTNDRPGRSQDYSYAVGQVNGMDRRPRGRIPVAAYGRRPDVRTNPRSQMIVWLRASGPPLGEAAVDRRAGPGLLWLRVRRRPAFGPA